MKRYLYLLIGLILLSAGWWFRSQNATEAKRLAGQVVQQDLSGDAAAQNGQAHLAGYVSQHSGASVTYTLQGSYNRDLATAKAAMAAASAVNSQIYAAAQKACASKSDSVTQAKCNQDYLAKNLKAPATAVVVEPVLGNYQRKLTSPAWAPDLAGSLLLGGGVAVVWGLMNLLISRRRS